MKEPNRIGEDHMANAKKARDRLREENHRREVMRLEMLRYAIRKERTTKSVPDSIEPNETAPSA